MLEIHFFNCFGCLSSCTVIMYSTLPHKLVASISGFTDALTTHPRSLPHLSMDSEATLKRGCEDIWTTTHSNFYS